VSGAVSAVTLRGEVVDLKQPAASGSLAPRD